MMLSCPASRAENSAVVHAGRQRSLHFDVQITLMLVPGEDIQHRKLVVLEFFVQYRIKELHLRNFRLASKNCVEV